MEKRIYLPKYTNAFALVIGINKYRNCPLACARQDAEAFAELLVSRCNFAAGNVTLLIDAAASRQRIRSAFLGFTRDRLGHDDRLLFFFAGHGHTEAGRRGEVGYLVPADGNADKLATLIRWDELTDCADQIQAKHVLFLVDACYGGLAINRALAPLASRYLKDMLQRYSRQALAAGKANEPVADAGGPRAGHSVFTGHLLDALEGNAAMEGKVISANSVMHYVHERVANDKNSKQTPHFGWLDGDGDFILAAPGLLSLSADDKIDDDLLVQMPASSAPDPYSLDSDDLVISVKEYLSDAKYRIRLDDLVTGEVRGALHALRREEFPVQGTNTTPQEFIARLGRYETAVDRLSKLTILIARWGEVAHQGLLNRIVSRLADSNDESGGLVTWLGFQWYPLLYLFYVGGIAALSQSNYHSLLTLFKTRVNSRRDQGVKADAIVTVFDGMLDVERVNYFKSLPGHENHLVPRSEYLHKTLQPKMEDALLLGKAYEELFDRFEVLCALTYSDLTAGRYNGWGPPGRFGWKYYHFRNGNPYKALVDEAREQGEKWLPLKQGLFGGSYEHFTDVEARYRTLSLDKLAWH